MVQVMESWFLADRDKLAQHFGEGFNAKALPGSATDVESIPKLRVEEGLHNATRLSRKKAYRLDKPGHGRELLLRIDARKVRKASPECNRLFAALADLL